MTLISFLGEKSRRYFFCEKVASMANVKQGNLTKSPQWWRHLRDWKRIFWKTERKAHKREIKNES
jgi:hypothetical protein